MAVEVIPAVEIEEVINMSKNYEKESFLMWRKEY